MGGRIYISSNSGASWIPRETDRNWKSVASSANGTKLIAAVEGGQIYTSTDSGVSWTASESNRSWRSVATSADGTKSVAAASSGQIYTSYLSSPSETTTPGSAGYLLGGRFTSVELQYVGGGQFLPISYKGTIFGF